MPGPAVPAPGSIQHRKTLTVLRVLMAASIILPLVILAGGGGLAWKQQRQEAEAETIRLLDLVTDSSAKLFDAQLLALEQARQLIAGRDDDAIFTQQREIHDRFAAMLGYLPFLRDIFVVNRFGHGFVSGATYPANSAYSLMDRDFFRYFHNGGTGRFIGRLAFRYFNGDSFIPVAVPRALPDGTFNGVIVCSINPQFFEQFFRQVLSTYPDYNNRSISLRRDDGQLVARSQQLTPGNDVKAAVRSAEMMSRTEAQSGQAVSSSLGDTRFVVWQRLPKLGLVVFTSVSLHGIISGWINSMIPYAALCLCVALSLFSISLVAVRQTEEAIAAEGAAEDERRRREQAEDAARQSQKMEALGKLTGGVAHDFNNLLAVIQGNAELAKTRPPDKIGRMLDNVLHASRRGAALTRQLLSFSRAHAVAPRVLSPQIELPRMMDLLRPSLRGDIEIVLQVAPDVWAVEVDSGEFEIALLNIAVNARDAMPDGGRLTVSVRNVWVRTNQIPTAPGLSGDFVSVVLADTGTGIPADIAARAFEPFFTTKDVGHGTGLGLSQVYGFARQAGGAATIAGTAAGTTVTLYLPRTRKTAEPETGADQAAALPGDGPRHILLVEDNPDVAAITADIIRALGYDVVHVDRAQKALDLLATNTAFHLLITDVVMPDGVNGVELARMVRTRMPGLPIILVSGYNDATPAQAAGFRLLRKPLPAQELARAIQAELRTAVRVPDQASAG